MRQSVGLGQGARRERVRALGLEGAVRFTGLLTDTECLELLQRAQLFAAPSRGEGFDLPALEAMAKNPKK